MRGMDPLEGLWTSVLSQAIGSLTECVQTKVQGIDAEIVRRVGMAGDRAESTTAADLALHMRRAAVDT